MLYTGPVPELFIFTKATLYAYAVEKKYLVLDNCVRFIDGTVLRIVRLRECDVQNVAYNDHKRKHRFKFQTVTTPDKLILHAHGATPRCWHEWVFYVT